MKYFQVNGSWGAWKHWSGCSQTCGEGNEVRKRVCDSPAPARGGRECEGDDSEQRKCHMNPCPGKQSVVSLSSLDKILDLAPRGL